jgi:hypothetical protein
LYAALYYNYGSGSWQRELPALVCTSCTREQLTIQETRMQILLIMECGMIYHLRLFFLVAIHASRRVVVA